MAPLRLLAEQVLQRQMRSDTLQAFYGGMRLMGVDSFVVVRIIEYTFDDPNRPSTGQTHRLLLGHFLIRKLMCDAAEQADVEPRDLSFVNTLKILRCRLPEAPRSASWLRRWYQQLLTEVTAEALEPRRNRINPRVIKRKMSNCLKKRDNHRNYPQPTKTFRKSIVTLD